MCGLFGLVRSTQCAHPEPASGVFLDLGRLAERRGRDAAGFALGHTRHASQGAPGRLANAHPLEVGSLVGAVNGDIDADDLRDRLPAGLPAAQGETDSEILLLALNRVRGDLGAVCEVLAAVRGPAALAWVDRARPGLAFLARGALCPLTVAQDTHGHLYWGSSPTWFHGLDERTDGRLGFQVERVREGTLLVIATDRAGPTVVAKRSFTPTARTGDEQRQSIWAGLDTREVALFQAEARHRIAPAPDVTYIPAHRQDLASSTT